MCHFSNAAAIAAPNQNAHQPMIPRARLEAIPFFAAFPRPAVKVMADRAIERKYDTAQTIFRAGESPMGLMVVLEGKPVADLPLVALQEVPAGSFITRTWDTVRLWFKQQ